MSNTDQTTSSADAGDKGEGRISSISPLPTQTLLAPWHGVDDTPYWEAVEQFREYALDLAASVQMFPP